MTANDFKSGCEAVVKHERAKAQSEGVPEIADDLLLIPAPRHILDVPAFPVEAARFLAFTFAPSILWPPLQLGRDSYHAISPVHCRPTTA